ncbi:lipocalin family protein [Aquimarina megaterium]|uniref:lipocalin family protein n=1 Tax=Aquimarina megaterium TaxID=1443666 RepID=UPI0009F5D64E|nr:lipocalin family protein [Aquimarina megaterium]
MKKYCLLSFIIMGIVMISCNNDDDKENENPSLASVLVGKWGQTSFRQNGELMNITDCEKRSTIEFTSTSYTEIGYAPVNTDCQVDFEITGTWTEEGDKLTLNYVFEGETTIDITTFMITDNVLTITYNDEGAITTFDYKKL